MTKKILFALLLFSSLIYAQPNENEEEPPPYNEGSIASTLLPQAIASGVNYYSFIPLKEGPSALLIDNLAQRNNDILLVGEDHKGNRISQVLNLESLGDMRVSKFMLAGFKHVYLISLQPFHVQSEKPMNVLGLKTRHFTTVSPARRLELMQVEDGMGKTITVGVTADGVAYYPVFGYKFGRYDAEARFIEKKDGMLYEVIR